MTLRAELAARARAELGEGPVWDPGTSSLIWLDLLQDRLHRSTLTSDTTTTIQLDRTVGAVALRPDGRLVAAVAEGFADLDDDGTITVFARTTTEPAGHRMNDGKCAPDGSFWAGTMAQNSQPGAGTLYRLATDHSITPILTGLTVSNGLGWAPDGHSAYFIDTATQRVDRLTMTEDSILRSPFVTIERTRGVPDGLTVDAEGNVWVALCFGGRVLAFDPDGREFASIEVPAAITTSVSFGGPALDTLLITTGRTSLSPEQLHDQPLSGSVFACRTGTTGLPPDLYHG